MNQNALDPDYNVNIFELIYIYIYIYIHIYANKTL